MGQVGIRRGDTLELEVGVTRLLVFVYAYAALLAVGLLIFHVALGDVVRSAGLQIRVDPQGRRIDVSADEEEDEGDRPLWKLVRDGALTVVALAAVSVAVAFLLTHVANLVAAAFCLLVSAVAWGRIGWAWHRLGLTERVPNQAVSVGLRGLAALVCGFAWLAAPSWVTYDATFLLLAVSAARASGAVTIRTALTLFGLLVVFDVWGVWVSGVTVTIATALDDHPLPLLLLVPSRPWVWSMDPLVGLGIGDYVVASMMVGAFKRHGLAGWAVAGFALGVFLALLLPFEFSPALLTLVPSILLCGGLGHLLRRTGASSKLGTLAMVVAAVVALRLLRLLGWLARGAVRVRGGRVEAPAVEYQHPCTGRRVALVGTVHVADTAYWQAIQELVSSRQRAGYRVCYEHVRPLTEAESAALTDAQRELARQMEVASRAVLSLCKATGLVYQRDGLAYRDSWINTDMSQAELIDALADAGVDSFLPGLEEELKRLAGRRWVKVLGPWLFDRVLECLPLLSVLGTTRHREWKRVVVDVRSEIGVRGALREAESADVVSIWGAGHVRGMSLLLERAGYRRVARRWYSVRKLSPVGSVLRLLPAAFGGGDGE